jgi:hypothetical protein
MRSLGGDEVGAFLGGFASGVSDEACCLDYAAGGGNRCNVGIEHHAGEGAVAFEWVLVYGDVIPGVAVALLLDSGLFCNPFGIFFVQ